MKVKIGDIFDSSCTTLVNTVNCVGVMGKGIALDFKKKFPKMFGDYVNRCQNDELKPGVPYFYLNDDGTSILNFPTKDHWRSPSKLSYIIEGLDWFVDNYENAAVKSIAFPPLGCGNGGLSWSVVGPIMYKKLADLPIQIEIYAPYGTHSDQLSEEFLKNSVDESEITGKFRAKLNPKWLLILEVVRELNERKYSINVGRTIYQKICYVMTRSGINTDFKFVKASYGPFSPNVKESLNVLANMNLVSEKRLGRMMAINVRNTFKFIKEDYTDEELDVTRKTIDLFGRIKSTDQAEMVATVLYSYDELVKTSVPITDKDVYEYVMDWKPHWKDEKSFDVCETIQDLAMISMISIKHDKDFIDTSLV